MDKQRWKKLFALGERQERVVTLAQAVECGIPPTTFHENARRLGMVRVSHGVWALPAAPNTYRRKLWVVKLALGDDVVFTGRTALWLRRVITATPHEADVLLPPGTHQRARPGVRFHRGRPLDDDSIVNLEGFRTACVYRAFTDVSAVAPVESLMRWIPAMDRLRLGHLDGLDEYVVRRGRFPGVVNTRAAAAALRNDLPHSGAERLARRSLRDVGIRFPTRPYPVKVGGAIIAEIDIAFPDVKYGVEIDGPHHRLPEVAQADKGRDRRLAREGWTIDRFTCEEVEGATRAFVAEVRRGLDGARARISTGMHH